MKKLGNVLMLVAAIAVLGQTAWAANPICCGTNGSCEWATEQQCSPIACPPDNVCWGVAGVTCTGAVGGCRLRNGDCILVDMACVDALRCTPDAACLMPPEPEREDEEVTWCDADGPEEEGDTPCKDEGAVQAIE